MPKDEFDPEDPLELQGVAWLTGEDTSTAMAECFVEEYLRLGYDHLQLLALFRNPHYLGLNMVWQNQGEPFVRDIIRQVFQQWGRTIEWEPTPPATPGSGSPRPDPTPSTFTPPTNS